MFIVCVDSSLHTTSYLILFLLPAVLDMFDCVLFMAWHCFANF